MGFMRPEFLVILVVVLLIFGPKKLPEMGSAIGKSIKEFRKGVHEIQPPKDEEEKAAETNRLELEALEREIALKKAAATAQETAKVKAD